ncbi:hypothetical protein GQ44DRAFT_699224 [Phaeosphaeriaceae sp. PMI808]|nr:hypothetical protein GQ44DRAFT_699224 [Phaeosphaeriaceae sp. PMI808]
MTGGCKSYQKVEIVVALHLLAPLTPLVQLAPLFTGTRSIRVPSFILCCSNRGTVTPTQHQPSDQSSLQLPPLVNNSRCIHRLNCIALDAQPPQSLLLDQSAHKPPQSKNTVARLHERIQKSTG